MKALIFIFLSLFLVLPLQGQINSYEISFENAVHHEAVIHATFPQITFDTLSLRMARSSPGRYALHEFAKNVYAFKATDSKGKPLKVYRPNPYEWQITGHDGVVIVSYTLFANRADGTYSQIDETHAHLNIPATFMYVPGLSDRKIEVNFTLRGDLNWKVATQLPLISGTRYWAPNLQYFMDSPTEISNYALREFQIDGKNVRFVLHHNGTENELDLYFEKVKKVVLAEKEVFGELPNFDYSTYTFLACYIPNASGDGMEHRNSTIVTSTRGLGEGGMEGNIGTVSHEFFHAWNVERIRPKSLEPFDFSKANMSGELWFAEGFTSYYTNLFLCRAGIISVEDYVTGLTGNFNYVWNSPARKFYSPIEMSYQAPFVDAATSVDPNNYENTFISYYSYGSVLGLALDLSLRQENRNLDDYMKLMWQKFGTNERAYTLLDLKETLREYAGKPFADNFFDSYIYSSKMPDYNSLFTAFGLTLKQNLSMPYFGAVALLNGDGNGEIRGNTPIGSPAYLAGLDNGDIITSISGMPFPDGKQFDTYLRSFNVGDRLEIGYDRYGLPQTTTVTLGPDPAYVISLIETDGTSPSQDILKKRSEWLKN
ncbi:MAG: peptidase M61 [Maribacter sp.]|nr:peptidase M61 [Maribacter sp.]